MIQYEDEYRRSSDKFSINPLLNADLLKFIKIREQLVNCSIWTIYWFNLLIAKRVFEPKTKRRKPLETLGFGKFGGFGKYKVQRTLPSLIWWIHCDSSILNVQTDPIIGTYSDEFTLSLLLMLKFVTFVSANVFK